MLDIDVSFATMALWMYFWTPGDWVTAPAGQVPIGSLALLGVGRVIIFGLLIKELLVWIL